MLENPDQPETVENTTPPENSENKASSPDTLADIFPIVGIGASAGGLTAFEQFFTSVPPDSGMAFVVVQHLSPPHKSILPEILQRFTSMTVTQVTEGMTVKPNNVYVIPPGSNLAFKDGCLMLSKPDPNRALRLPIDFFFRSIALDQSARGIGIVLSGTGSDGSQGLKNIKAEGGLTIAQEPETAEFGDMPRNAIATRDVDFIVAPREMGELLMKYSRHQLLDAYKRPDNSLNIPSSGLQKLFFILRKKTGHDFSLYKQNTLLRRIERRMKICLVKNTEEYIDRLMNDPKEVEALFQEMLINVTHFFRDPEAFEALSSKVMARLVSQVEESREALRVWVAGCASGEEAYSIAILIQEHIDEIKANIKVQIYATDLDADAIDTARKGFFREGSLENVSPERLERFFFQEEEGYQVKKSLRDMVVFSTQNLIADPPFSKIDLLCCRNLLIYLEHELQNYLLLRFHYSLKSDGVLFLGNSESLGGNSDLFSVVDRKHKIFQRKNVDTQRGFESRSKLLPQLPITLDFGKDSGRKEEGGLQEWMEAMLLEYHTPACVIIDEKHNILFIHGRTGEYLEPVPGEISSNLVRMAREGLKTELATALHAAVDQKRLIRRENILVKTNGHYKAINLTVRPAEVSSKNKGLIMVVFEEAAPVDVNAEPSPLTEEMKTDGRVSSSRRVRQLQKELKDKDEYLHAVIDELENTNQDLKSSNEELQSMNEEMQSTNEELETSKEELQSINEELSTINTELQNKNEELSAVNNDIFNLLASIEIGTIFLDLDLKIRRFTPAIGRIYNFIGSDIGRPLANFVSTLEYDHLLEDVKQVLRTLAPKAIEARTKDGNWFLVNIRPYRTLENVIDGMVITFVDINSQKQQDKLRRLGTILQDSNDAVTMQDFSGNILTWNRGATLLYGWTESEALKMKSEEMIPPEKRAEFTAVVNRLAKGATISSFETRRLTREGKTVDVWMTMTALVDEANRPVAVATTERDVTERKDGERIYNYENRVLHALNSWYQMVLDTHTPSLTTLADKACQALVEEAGYQIAWIGKIRDSDKQKVVQVARAEAGIKVEPSLKEHIQVEINRALDLGMPMTISNRSAAYFGDLSDSQFESCLILPIQSEGHSKGILVVYSTEGKAFLQYEVEALQSFSNQVARRMNFNL